MRADGSGGMWTLWSSAPLLLPTRLLKLEDTLRKYAHCTAATTPPTPFPPPRIWPRTTTVSPTRRFGLNIFDKGRQHGDDPFGVEVL